MTNNNINCRSVNRCVKIHNVYLPTFITILVVCFNLLSYYLLFYVLINYQYFFHFNLLDFFFYIWYCIAIKSDSEVSNYNLIKMYYPTFTRLRYFTFYFKFTR